MWNTVCELKRKKEKCMIWITAKISSMKHKIQRFIFWQPKSVTDLSSWKLQRNGVNVLPEAIFFFFSTRRRRKMCCWIKLKACYHYRPSLICVCTSSGCKAPKDCLSLTCTSVQIHATHQQDWDQLSMLKNPSFWVTFHNTTFHTSILFIFLLLTIHCYEHPLTYNLTSLFQYPSFRHLNLPCKAR